MNLLSDILTYIRRIIKSPSNATITDNLLIDYINRFWIMDVDARIQLFDLKTHYNFQTVPGVDRYNMPLYDVQTEPGNQTIGSYPVYQGFTGDVTIAGVKVPFYTQRSEFYNTWQNYIQPLQAIATGNGTAGPYTITIPFSSNSSVTVNPSPPTILRGHVDMAGIIATGTNQDPPVNNTLLVNAAAPYNGNSIIPVTSVDPAVYFTSTDATGANVVVCDSGQFLTGNVNYGLLMTPGNAPFGNQALPGGYNVSFVITGITTGFPTVITANNTLSVGQTIMISGVVGTTELNGNTYTVSAVSPTTVTIDITTTNAYISGGTITSLQNVINYLTGVATNVFFPAVIPAGQNINVQCYYYNPGLPRAVLYYNNVITLRSIPFTQYLVQMDAYLSPAAFLNTSAAIPFGYMAEYIARGAARKILSDTGDVEQLQFYEPMFKEQETLVWKRSQRQFTSTRTQTIFSQGFGTSNNNSMYSGGY